MRPEQPSALISPVVVCVTSNALIIINEYEGAVSEVQNEYQGQMNLLMMLRLWPSRGSSVLL